MSDEEHGPGTSESDAPPAAEPRAGDGRTERLIRQLAELYNENTRLRHRVRMLEREMRSASERA